MSNQSERAEKTLNEKELDAYRRYVESAKPALSPSTAAQFYALFLQGYTCDEIAQQNPAYGLGLVCKARIDYDWDGQREQYIKKLMDSVADTVQKATLEGIQFAADGMAMFHRMAGKRFRKYLQTDNEADLGDWKDMTFKSYKEMVELFMKLTGHDEKDKKISGTVRHVVETAEGAPALAADRPVSPSEAASLLKLIGGSN